MQLLYKNELKEATLLSTNEDSSYPITNIIHKFLLRKFQTTIGTNSTVITIEFMEDKTINCIALGYTNASSGTYTVYNSVSAVVGTGSIDTNYSTDMTYFVAVPTVRKIELTISSVATPLYIGGVSAGSTLYFPFHNTNPRIDFTARDKVKRTEGGQVIGKKTKRLLKYRAVLGTVVQEKFEEFLDLYDEVGNVDPIYYDLYDEAHNVARPIYSVLEGDGSFRRFSVANEWSHTVVANEAR